MAEKLTGNWVSDRTLFSELIEKISGPFSPHTTTEAWLRKASVKTGLSMRTVKGLFYKEITNPKWDVALAVIQAAQRSSAAAARLDALILASKFEAIAGMIDANQDGTSEDAAEIIRIASLLRNTAHET